MAIAVDKIVSEALALPPPMRAFVAEKLIESLDVVAGDELSPAWQEEVRRRCAEIDEGTAILSDAEAVFAKAYAALE
jgi:putative addiction module component (TIGR02574 family)